MSPYPALRSTRPEDRLAELGLTLPPPPGAVGAYAPWVISGGMLYMSGQLPWIAGDLKFKGKIGRQLTSQQGYDACKLSCLNAISQMQHALGDLSRVRRVVRMEGVLNVASGFTGHPKCLDGASDLLNAVFGDRGLHTRMIYTNPEMPLDCACLIICWVEIDS
jgi:enamine deaminase RidA (YjgF/YER057c/UK114 family)